MTQSERAAHEQLRSLTWVLHHANQLMDCFPAEVAQAVVTQVEHRKSLGILSDDHEDQLFTLNDIGRVRKRTALLIEWLSEFLEEMPNEAA